jgi:hypothetical protein
MPPRIYIEMAPFFPEPSPHPPIPLPEHPVIGEAARVSPHYLNYALEAIIKKLLL